MTKSELEGQKKRLKRGEELSRQMEVFERFIDCLYGPGYKNEIVVSSLRGETSTTSSEIIRISLPYLDSRFGKCKPEAEITKQILEWAEKRYLEIKEEFEKL